MHTLLRALKRDGCRATKPVKWRTLRNGVQWVEILRKNPLKFYIIAGETGQKTVHWIQKGKETWIWLPEQADEKRKKHWLESAGLRVRYLLSFIHSHARSRSSCAWLCAECVLSSCPLHCVHYGDKACIEVLPAPQIKSHRETFCTRAKPADPHHPAGARLPSTSPPENLPISSLVSSLLIYSLFTFFPACTVHSGP